MFCKNCGNELPDGAKFCTNCGVDCGNAGGAVTPSAPAKSSSSSRLPLILVIAAVVAIAVYFVSSSKGGNTSYKSAESVARAYVEAMCEYDAYKLVQTMPACQVRVGAEEYDLPENASRKEVAQKLQEQFDRYSVENSSVEIDSCRITDDVDLDEVFDEFLDDFDISNEEYNSVKEAVVVTVDATIEGDDESVDVICCKMGSSWYVLGID